MAASICLSLFARTASAQPAQPTDAPAEPATPPATAPTTAGEPSTEPARTEVRPEAGGMAGYNEPVAASSADTGDHARVDNSPLAHDGKPLAGYHNGLFFLRDHHDNYHLYIQGRSQLDFYSYMGKGVPDTTLKPNLFIRRVRPEVSGEFFGDHFRFLIAGDFGATAIDNPRGTNETFAAPPGTAPTPSSARFAPAETTRFQAAATDVFINYRQSGAFNVMVGQMDVPFTMENRTSDKYLPFMERSLAVRAVGIPTNKDIGGMLWGETESRLWLWSIGAYGGEGQNRPNLDTRADLYTRTFIHPFVATDMDKKNPLRDAQIGASFHYGSRDHKWIAYDYPAMNTQGAFAFWTPIYNGAGGFTHVIPSGDQIAAAGEIRIPVERFDLTSELVWIDNSTREAIEGYEANTTERYGRMQGVSYYVQLGWWPLGNRDINGVPGYGNPPRLDWSKADPVEPKQALQVLAKWEQVSLNYKSSSRGGTPDAKNIDGDIRVNAFSLGLNYWATRHVRITLDYVIDMFPSSGSKDNRAVAPGNTVAKEVNQSAHDDAHALHELLARFAIAL